MGWFKLRRQWECPEERGLSEACQTPFQQFCDIVASGLKHRNWTIPILTPRTTEGNSASSGGLHILTEVDDHDDQNHDRTCSVVRSSHRGPRVR